MQIGSFSLIKELNTSIILKIIRSHKSISRAEIAKLTGLTPATVTNITSSLLSYKIITETKLGKSSGGRKPVLLAFNYSEYNVIGVVISTHKITVTLTDLQANFINQTSKKFNNNLTPEKAFSYIKQSIAGLLKESDKKVLGIGVSSEGLVNNKDGINVFANNYGWENVPIKETLYNEFKIPVFVDNDVKSLALGEEFFGSTKRHNSFLLIYIGYGIGACLVENGRIYRGFENYASELGHTIIDINGPLCSCGNRGCFQSLASGKIILDKIQKLGYDKKYFINEDITVEKIIEKANNGSEELNSVILEQAKYIGIGISNAINIFNPPLIIINGNICKANDTIKSEIVLNIKKHTLKNMQNNMEVIFSKLDSDEKYKGAIALFISNFFENPEMFF